MSFQLSPEISFAENIARLSVDRLDRALVKLSHLSNAEPTPTGTPPEVAEAVHGARKDLKKIRALLRLARRAMPPRAFDRENISLRDAGRALSATRDAQVLVEVFDQLAAAAHPHGQPSAEALDRVRQRLAAAAEGTTHGAGLLPATREAASILEAVRARVPAWGVQDGGWRLLAGGLKAVYRAGRRQMAAAAGGGTGVGGDPAVWHEWRKQVKHLSCQMRLLRPLWPQVFKNIVGELDALAELLGDDHDLSVLQSKLNGNPNEAVAGTPAVVGEPWLDVPEELAALNGLISTRRAALQRQALETGRRVYQEKPARFSRRLRGYWQAWREEHPVEVRPAPWQMMEAA